MAEPRAFTQRQVGDCLRQHNAVWALPDQAWMPSPLSVVQRLDAVTGPFAYIRLLGDREAVDALTPTLDHVVIDRRGQVEQDAQAVQLLRQRVPVVAFVNNHFAGYAPETVQQLVALTGRVASAWAQTITIGVAREVATTAGDSWVTVR
jgi:hypothetical protein